MSPLWRREEEKKGPLRGPSFSSVLAAFPQFRRWLYEEKFPAAPPKTERRRLVALPVSFGSKSHASESKPKDIAGM
jgi:hypothetical protein